MRELLIALAISAGVSLLVPSVFATSRADETVRAPAVVSPSAQPATERSPTERPDEGQTADAHPNVRQRTPRMASARPPVPLGEPTAVREPVSAALEPVAATTSGLPPNEAGQVLVLEYHLIEPTPGRWTRTPDQLRADVARLIEEDYYPINLIDLARGYIDVPVGKSPVVLTFDDSSSGQCRYLPDGSVDPDSACGILLDAARRHAEDWRARATFFVLIDVDVAERELFGQPEWAQRKLRDLISHGMEIGSHTVSHIRLDRASTETIRRQLAEAETRLEQLVPDYEVRSLSLPMGLYPDDEQLLVRGQWQGQHYDNEAAVEVAGGPSPSPHSPDFDPLHIRRVQVFGDELDRWLDYFAAHSGLRYISDGQPSLITFPAPPALQ
jgi:peptidoglycan/xylan/chitin deacetylase (PgdA/CDA1 family)